MTKTFHAVESSRKWRDGVRRAVAGMSQRERIAYFQQFSSVAALKAAAIPTKALPLVLPGSPRKGLDAVLESRKWRRSARRRKLIAA